MVIALGGNALGDTPEEQIARVRAAVKFARSLPGRGCIIGSLDKAAEAVAGLSGTHIHA